MRALHPITKLFLAAVLLAGIVYAAFQLTPSSYGKLLDQMGAPQDGPILGEARYIRADEWAMITPFFQAAVNNGLQRINETSFYREDLRTCSILMGLPLKDWALLFKPHLWAFLIAPPAFAYSLYYALMLSACLIAYHFLMLRLGLDPPVAAAASLLIFFSGFLQFWWTTFAPLFVGFPLVLLILLSRLRWFYKAVLLAFTLSFCGFSTLYPTLFFELAFAAFILILAIRPSLLRSPGQWTAIAIAGIIMGVLLWTYYADIIPLMRATEYPGRRIAPPGTATAIAVLSQFLPYVSFKLSDYQNLRGTNICEIGALGTYLPLLTLCLARYRDLWNNRLIRRALIVMGAAFALMTLWQLAPTAPPILGRLLFWSKSPSQRLLLASGFLLTVASLLIWREGLISPRPLRIMLFVLVGPIAAAGLKIAVYHVPLDQAVADLALATFLLLAALATCYIRMSARGLVLLSAILLVNVYAFGRFNPLQPAPPIFRGPPATDAARELRRAQDSSPDHLLIDDRFLGATPNGMGFRSLSHALTVPRLEVFRQYFPAMDAAQFNQVFNRYCYIQVTADKLPGSPLLNVVNVPKEAFAPLRNARTAIIDITPRKDCSTQRGGGVDRVTAHDNKLVIEGWAPWVGEGQDQQLHVASARSLTAVLSTVRRPDISERMHDYAYTRSGFRLTLAGMDNKPLDPGDIVLVARNTSQGLAQLAGCGCL